MCEKHVLWLQRDGREATSVCKGKEREMVANEQGRSNWRKKNSKRKILGQGGNVMGRK